MDVNSSNLNYDDPYKDRNPLPADKAKDPDAPSSNRAKTPADSERYGNNLSATQLILGAARRRPGHSQSKTKAEPKPQGLKQADGSIIVGKYKIKDGKISLANEAAEKPKTEYKNPFITYTQSSNSDTAKLANDPNINRLVSERMMQGVENFAQEASRLSNKAKGGSLSQREQAYLDYFSGKSSAHPNQDLVKGLLNASPEDKTGQLVPLAIMFANADPSKVGELSEGISQDLANPNLSDSEKIDKLINLANKVFKAEGKDVAINRLISQSMKANKVPDPIKSLNDIVSSLEASGDKAKIEAMAMGIASNLVGGDQAKAKHLLEMLPKLKGADGNIKTSERLAAELAHSTIASLVNYDSLSPAQKETFAQLDDRFAHKDIAVSSIRSDAKSEIAKVAPSLAAPYLYESVNSYSPVGDQDIFKLSAEQHAQRVGEKGAPTEEYIHNQIRSGIVTKTHEQTLEQVKKELGPRINELEGLIRIAELAGNPNIGNAEVNIFDIALLQEVGQNSEALLGAANNQTAKKVSDQDIHSAKSAIIANLVNGLDKVDLSNVDQIAQYFADPASVNKDMELESTLMQAEGQKTSPEEAKALASLISAKKDSFNREFKDNLKSFLQAASSPNQLDKEGQFFRLIANSFQGQSEEAITQGLSKMFSDLLPESSGVSSKQTEALSSTLATMIANDASIFRSTMSKLYSANFDQNLSQDQKNLNSLSALMAGMQELRANSDSSSELKESHKSAISDLIASSGVFAGKQEGLYSDMAAALLVDYQADKVGDLMAAVQDLSKLDSSDMQSLSEGMSEVLDTMKDGLSHLDQKEMQPMMREVVRDLLLRSDLAAEMNLGSISESASNQAADSLLDALLKYDGNLSPEVLAQTLKATNTLVSGADSQSQAEIVNKASAKALSAAGLDSASAEHYARLASNFITGMSAEDRDNLIELGAGIYGNEDKGFDTFFTSHTELAKDLGLPGETVASAQSAAADSAVKILEQAAEEAGVDFNIESVEKVLNTLFNADGQASEQGILTAAKQAVDNFLDDPKSALEHKYRNEAFSKKVAGHISEVKAQAFAKADEIRNGRFMRGIRNRLANKVEASASRWSPGSRSGLGSKKMNRGYNESIPLANSMMRGAAYQLAEQELKGQLDSLGEGAKQGVKIMKDLLSHSSDSNQEHSSIRVDDLMGLQGLQKIAKHLVPDTSVFAGLRNNQFFAQRVNERVEFTAFEQAMPNSFQ